jgi:hypothetical protein
VELSDWGAGVLKEELQDVLPDPSTLAPVYTPKRDSFFTAPGWREVAVEYTCIPDAMYPWDPKVMRAINVFAPDAVPLWVRWVFRSPQDEDNPIDVVYGRHALGRAIENLEAERSDFTCSMPEMPCQGLVFSRPNRIWFIHEGERPQEKYVDLPGDYLPFDGTLVVKAEEAARGFRMTEKEYRDFLREKFIEQAEQGRRKRVLAIEDDLEQRRKDIAPYIERTLEKISDVEIGEYMRSVGQRR